ncbi:DUF2809 domain-containing protein [Flavobacterium sp.]|uniref:ribosomal maturation YjgA family protein n=1 Tax=Flavobacterium sp. TaxID=239 RepID=UPI00286E1B8B|nr:DUF2809 domain-containing protein [Flavobacterium sp.]
MLKNSRIQYFILVLIVIALGIASRKIDGIPTFFGDTLYAVMIYFGLRMLLVNFNIKKTAILALHICFAIEFLQLYDAEWMLEIRRTTFGHYALGQGFLWSDLGFYTLGIVIAFWMDSNWIRKK